MAFSTRRESAVEGGGAGKAFTIEDIYYVQEGNTFTEENGTVKASATIHVDWQIEGKDELWGRDYNVGNSVLWTVEDNGNVIRHNGGKDGFSKSSKAYLLMDSIQGALEAAGLDAATYMPDGPEDRPGTSPNIRLLKGLRGVTKFVDNVKKNGDRAKGFTIYVDAITEAPQVKASGASLDAKTVEYLGAAIEAAGNGGLKVSEIGQKLSGLYKADPDIKAVMQTAMRPAFQQQHFDTTTKGVLRLASVTA